MALTAGTSAACCSAMPSCLREDSQWFGEERMAWPRFFRGSTGIRGRSTSSTASSSRFCVVSRMGGGRRGGRSGGGRRGGRGRRGNRGAETVSEDDGPTMNERIRAPILRLIGEDSQQIGIVPREDAFQRAERLELDLVLISADSDPPVAKLMDYSKYKYEQQKKKRDQQKKAAASRVEIKELKMRYNIDTHDYEVRLKQAKNFLKDGDKVKVFMPFRGREAQFKDLGVKLLRKFEEDIGEMGSLENKLADEGRTMYMTLAPNKIQASKSEKSKPRQSKDEEDEEIVSESDEIAESEEEEDEENDGDDSAEEEIREEQATAATVS
ncbi:uncharacterized protein LOC9659076 [Selaginella moellendorffii]|uniref:uncharacterized protein LOC9658754 n=1 Tax=Selaginella moellendorffii TaxID=88036 RepID=UPI000D1CA04A|nr:uncharacterized protein LOC9658754 [Selaginella moellendorffii]XP_024525250.1 uncharacterized protein LOC9659076 [Selaginella moellendorffii]|eukprot:XP_024516168.1 uncharacterized protein LOC9658754 [Selaginella moellendorffii]